MNIPEAIVTLDNEQKDHHSYPTDTIGKAERLGVEALKEIQHLHESQVLHDDELLPGETEK